MLVLIMATKRVRGVNALLSDVTNVASGTPAKRSCASRAGTRIMMSFSQYAPRGRTALSCTPPAPASPAPEIRVSPRDLGGRRSSPDEDVLTLDELSRNMRHVLEGGVESIHQYVERNCSFPILKGCALRIFGGCILSGKGILEASEMAATCTGFSSSRIRKWASAVFCGFFSTISNLEDVTDQQLERELESGKGRHPKWVSLMSDESFQKEVRKYVLEHGYKKGAPNLTLQQLVTWLKETHKVEVCISTVSNWLHDMGFTYKQHSKGVYFDGHEREDVVEDRKAYLAVLQSYNPRLWISHSPAPNPSCRPVIRVFHDESTFYANADQSFHWTDGSKQVRVNLFLRSRT